jgi:hypothetical protein
MSLVKEEPVANTETGQHKPRLSTDAIAGAGQTEPRRAAEDLERDERIERPPARDGARLEPLFDDTVDRDFRNRWRDIQTGFVDEPRRTVEQADELVAELMQRLAQSFSEQRSTLERQWDASDEVSTEDLRVALTRYRSFFERLLSV